MDLSKVKTINDLNIDKIIKDNLYRGHDEGEGIIKVQCMDKYFHITFDFIQETAIIQNDHWSHNVPIESSAPKAMKGRIVKATC